jgi:hypothetical protein
MVSKIARAAALVSALALLTGGGAAQAQDLRSPDARDAAASQDLRSPDAADAATAAPTIELSSPEGFDWASAGIGAGGSLGLILVVAAGATAVAQRPRARAGR